MKALLLAWLKLQLAAEPYAALEAAMKVEGAPCDCKDAPAEVLNGDGAVIVLGKDGRVWLRLKKPAKTPPEFWVYEPAKAGAPVPDVAAHLADGPGVERHASLPLFTH